MSLLPYMFNDYFYRPSRLLYEYYGLGMCPEDMLDLIAASMMFSNCYRPQRSIQSKYKPGVITQGDKEKFKITLDVQQFEPDEIDVKVSDNEIIVECKQDEGKDDHGYISKEFTRRYVVPDEYDIEKVSCELSSDGVLTITAPKLVINQEGRRAIPINLTGRPVDFNNL